MAWYDNAVFYHIYPLGLTGAPLQNPYREPVHRLNTLIPWIDHISDLGCSALYIGPLFESVGHGYETTDYRKVDSRLGTNEDLKAFVAQCHRKGIRVILDGVFNHVGRDFFAFQDLKKNRENSPYRDWFCNVNFWNNNEYNDGFSYDNWGGYNLLVKLNQRNPEVQTYLCDSIRMWVSEFDIDGLRLDAADVLDFGFMQTLSALAREVKNEFWLMGEVIHGDYTRWVNSNMLNSVTDYNLHKALYSGVNDHNFFEIAHTVKRIYDMGLNRPGGMKLYSFVDNHDVERIYTKLQEKANFTPVHILLFTLPGIPSIYYGSEFAIEGRKERGSDASLRPALNLDDYSEALTRNPYTALIKALAHLRRSCPPLQDGDYRELVLTTKQYAFARTLNGSSVLTAVNNENAPAQIRIPAEDGKHYTGVLSGQKITVSGGILECSLEGNSGEVWVPDEAGYTEAVPLQAIAAQSPAKKETAQKKADMSAAKESPAPESAPAPAPASTPAPESAPAQASAPAQSPAKKETAQKASEKKAETKSTEKKAAPIPRDKSYEEMTVEELQSVILEKLAKNGPVTDRMRKDVEDNIWHDSLVTWARSF